MKKVVAGILFFVLLSGLVAAEVSVGEGIKEKSNDFLLGELELSGGLTSIVKWLFGIDSGEQLKLQTFIVLCALFILLLFLFTGVLGLFPFLRRFGLSWIGGTIVALLITATGILREGVDFLLGVGGLFGEWMILTTSAILILVAIVFAVLSRIIYSFKKSARFAEAKSAGDDLAVERVIAKRTVRGAKRFS